MSVRRYKNVALMAAVLLVIDLIAVVFHAGRAESMYPGTAFSCKGKLVASRTAAIVFYGDRGVATRHRVERAVQLFKNGCAGSLYMVGGLRPKTSYHGAKWMVNLAKNQDIDQQHLAHGRGSNDTRSNLAAAFILAEQQQINELIFISDAMHLYRILYLARRINKEGRYKFHAAAAKYGSSSFFYRLQRFHQELAAYLLYKILPDTTLDALFARLRR